VGGSGSVTRVTSDHQFNAAAVKVITDGSGGFQYIYAPIPAARFVAAQQYTISAYLKASTGTPTVRFYCESSAGAIGSVGNITLSTTWTRYTVTVTMPNPIVATAIGLRWDTGAGAQAITVYMDGLQVEKAAAASTWVSGENVGVTQEALIYLIAANATGPVKYNGTYATDGYGFGIGNGADWSAAGQKIIGRTNYGWIVPSSPVTVPLGVWTHVAVRWGNDGIVTFYINSVAVATALYGATTPTGLAHIGHTSNGDIANNMDIDEVVDYPTTLVGTRISAHYGAMANAAKLIRQGEVTVTDATGTKIFGGYATLFEDASLPLVVKTKISCHDYFQSLDRIMVNEVYLAKSDIFIIKDILTKYAPWIDQTALPAAASVTFPTRFVRAQSVMMAIQSIGAVTGFMVWVTPDKKMHYASPTSATTAPFNLSDNPDFITLREYDFLAYKCDDNAIINRVYFYGGKNVSPDFTQDLRAQTTATNKVFSCAYYPHDLTAGPYTIIKNGVTLVKGSPFDTGSTGKLIADGGTAEVLVNATAKTLTFNTAPGTGLTQLDFNYRYETPLVIVISDKSSNNFYGAYYDSKLDDQTVLDSNTAISRSRSLLAQQSYGLVSAQVVLWSGGIQAGMLLSITNGLRNLTAVSYLVQKVSMVSMGSGFFEYTVDLGAWNWDNVDIIMAAVRKTATTTLDNETDTQVVQAQLVGHTANGAIVFTKKTGASGVYYSRATAVVDGADAYSGFFTITT
jgi:hypothetical protein